MNFFLKFIQFGAAILNSLSPKCYQFFTPSLSGKFYDEIYTYLGDGDNACSYSNKLEISLCLILSRTSHELDVKA